MREALVRAFGGLRRAGNRVPTSEILSCQVKRANSVLLVQVPPLLAGA